MCWTSLHACCFVWVWVGSGSLTTCSAAVLEQHVGCSLYPCEGCQTGWMVQAFYHALVIKAMWYLRRWRSIAFCNCVAGMSASILLSQCVVPKNLNGGVHTASCEPHGWSSALPCMPLVLPSGCIACLLQLRWWRLSVLQLAAENLLLKLSLLVCWWEASHRVLCHSPFLHFSSPLCLHLVASFLDVRPCPLLHWLGVWGSSG